MKLQKALSPNISYPKHKYISPLLIGSSIAMALSACSTDKVSDEHDMNTSTSQKQEIKQPENILGEIRLNIK